MKMTERKHVVVLGGSSGIGKAIAERFANEGWRVTLASSNNHKVQEACAALKGSGHRYIVLDVRDDSQLAAMVTQFTEEKTVIDVLINSIGISDPTGVMDPDFDKWNDALQVMLYGTVKCCRGLVPFMPDGGRIIHITSIHYERVEKGSSAYGIAKSAVTQFTRSLALELAHRNILANTIAPGFIDTPMSVNSEGENELHTKWFYDNYVLYDHLPLKRAGRPEEVAGVAYFLAGPDASYMTGSVVTVDGGLTITF